MAVIDPEERSLRAQVALDGPPSAVAAAAGAVWVADDRNGSVSRIDPATNTVRQTVTVGHGQSDLAAGRDGVWAANRQDGTVSLISAATNQVVDTITAGSPSDVCLRDGDVWVAGASAGRGRCDWIRRRTGKRRHRRRRQPVGAGVRRRRGVGSRRSAGGWH